MSEVAIFLNDKDDGLGDIRSVLKEEMGKHHAEHINQMLLQDVDTPAGNDLESLDRLTANACFRILTTILVTLNIYTTGHTAHEVQTLGHLMK